MSKYVKLKQHCSTQINRRIKYSQIKDILWIVIRVPIIKINHLSLWKILYSHRYHLAIKMKSISKGSNSFKIRSSILIPPRIKGMYKRNSLRKRNKERNSRYLRFLIKWSETFLWLPHMSITRDLWHLEIEWSLSNQIELNT